MSLTLLIGGIFIKLKTRIILVILIVVVLIAGNAIKKTLEYNKSGNLIEISEEDGLYTEKNPLRVDKLDRGIFSIRETLSIQAGKDVRYAEFDDETIAQEFVQLLRSTEVKRSKEHFDYSPYYFMRLRATDYPELFVLFQKYDDKLLIGLNSAEPYETTDLTIYNTFIDMFEISSQLDIGEK